METRTLLILISGFNIISGKLKDLQPSSQELQAAKYGKVPRSVGIANNVSSNDVVLKQQLLCFNKNRASDRVRQKMGNSAAFSRKIMRQERSTMRQIM